MSTSATIAVPTNPFPGLRPFREDEEYLFFGRESQVDAMVDILAATRFLAVVGTSGSGKSSLVNCGLRPALHRGLLARAGTAWRMAQFRPGSDPLGALARALAGDGVLFRDYEADGLTLAEIIDTTLRMSKLGLIDIYEQARLGERVNLLVVVDQFEELFRYRQLGAAQKENAYGVSAEATAFVNLLLEVREQTNCSIYVVLTMRSDFLGDCAQFPGLPEAINAGQYLVPRLTRDERRAAISGPVGVGGAEIAPVLLTRLVNDVGDNPDQLSILQHALNRTWACWQQEGDGKRPLGLTHYDAIGTMAHALDQHAEDAYAELAGERQQHICAKLFKALTDKATDPRGIRRPTTLGTLCALAVATAAEVTEVIDVFREPSRSFVMPPAGEALNPETVIDISHESLMRVWERLQAWADEEAQSARLYRRLAETAVLHEAGQASLWRDPDLQLVLDWQAKEQPTAVWAARYHEGFAPAISFLQASVARRDEEAREQEARRQEQETQRQRALEQAQALAEEQRRRAEEQARAARRLRWLSGGLFVIFFFAVVAAVFAWSQSYRAQQQTRIATSRRLAAQALSRYIRLDLALLSSLEANHITDIVETRGSLLDGLQRSPHLTTFLTGHTSSVVSVAFSPDGRTLASGSYDNIILWDVASRQPLGQPLTGHTNVVRSVAFSPDGKLLASGSWDKTLILWDVASRQPLGQPLTGHTSPVGSVTFSPDGTTLASGSDDKTLILWDVASRRPLGQPLIGHTSHVLSVAFSPDGRTLASGSYDNIILWDVASRQPLGQPLTGHTHTVTSVAFSPDGKLLVSGSWDKTLILWDVASRQPLGQPLTGHTSSVESVAFSPDGTTLVSGSDDNIIILWDVASRQPLGQPLTGHTSSVLSVAFSPDGRTLASGSVDQTLILWDVASRQPLGQPLTGHTHTVVSVAFSPDGRTLASGSDDKTLILWDVASRQPLGQPLTGHTNVVRSVAFSPDGKLLASGSWDKTLILWDVASRQPLGQPLTGHTHTVMSAAFSPDGKLLVSGSWDKTLILWDVANRQPLGQPLTGHTSPVVSVAFGPDGKLLVSGSWDKTLILWDVANRQPLGQPLTGHNSSVRSVAFSPDGKLLVSGSHDNIIILWDVANRQPLGQPLTGHTSSVGSVAFSPDGTTLVSGNDDNTLILWDVASRQPLGQPLTGHTSSVGSVAFSPDGKLLASGSSDNTIRLWDVSLKSWQDRACRIANRNLTRAEWKRYIGDIEPYRATCPP